jgi:hypothetical protein
MMVISLKVNNFNRFLKVILVNFYYYFLLLFFFLILANSFLEIVIHRPVDVSSSPVSPTLFPPPRDLCGAISFDNLFVYLLTPL